MKIHLRIIFALFVYVVSNNIYAINVTYTHSFNVGNMKVGNVEWTDNATGLPLLWIFSPTAQVEEGTIMSYELKGDGLKIGTSASPFTGMQLKTSAIPGIIKSVKISATSSATSSNGVAVLLSIDGRQVGEAQSLGNDISKKITLKADASGEICISFTPKGKQSTSFTLKEISIQYDAPTVAVSIGDTGYATLYNGTRPLWVPLGLTASTYTVNKGKMVETKRYVEKEVIPAGAGVVLHGVPGSYEFVETFTAGGTAPDNMLKGSDVDVLTDGDKNKCYMLSLNAQKDINSVGFYYGAPNGGRFVSKAHHAYLAIPRSAMAKSCYMFHKDITGIQTVPGIRLSCIGIYTLQGVRVMGKNLPHGIYIVDGKKVVL